jgi:hypothetical protein
LHGFPLAILGNTMVTENWRLAEVTEAAEQMGGIPPLA